MIANGRSAGEEADRPSEDICVGLFEYGATHLFARLSQRSRRRRVLLAIDSSCNQHWHDGPAPASDEARDGTDLPYGLSSLGRQQHHDIDMIGSFHRHRR